MCFSYLKGEDMKEFYDAVIVGGGPAGLSGAIKPELTIPLSR